MQFFRLDKKGPFAAALRHGATLVPCFSHGDGRVHVGRAVCAGPPQDTPMPNDVATLADKYAAALKEVAEMKAGVTLRIAS